MQTIKIRGWVIGICCALSLVACSKSGPIKLDVKGVYDGHSYTAPYALFSTHLEGWADLASVKDEAQNEGASQLLTFKDKDGNAYQMMASFGNPMMDGHTLLAQMVKQGQDQGKNVVLTKNADDEECLFAQSMIKAEDADKGFGLTTMIFLRQGVIYDLTVKSHPADSPEQAKQVSQDGFRELWNRTRFRGHLADLDQYPAGIDPRIPASVVAAAGVAKALGYEARAEYGKKTIVHIIGKGNEDVMTYSLGIVADEEKLVTTEAVACKANDMPAMKIMQTVFYKEFGQAMAEEKLTVTRSDAFDPELVQLPKKQ